MDLETFAADLEAPFTDFGVSRQYAPRQGRERLITVLERVRPLGPIDPMPEGLAPVAEVIVRNDALTGIARLDLDTGGDKIQVLLNGELQMRPITRVMHEDEAHMRLEVR